MVFCCCIGDHSVARLAELGIRIANESAGFFDRKLELAGAGGLAKWFHLRVASKFDGHFETCARIPGVIGGKCGGGQIVKGGAGLPAGLGEATMKVTTLILDLDSLNSRANT
jgi:hypothetical protein